MKVKVTDNSEIFRNAKDAAVRAALEAIGLSAERYAKAKCPVDTGRLRGSITHEVDKGEAAVYIGTNVEYGKYVERGTSRSRKQPFLQPAAANHSDEYKRIAENCLKNA